MDINSAKIKLEAAKRLQRHLRNQITELRKIIKDAGENPDIPKRDVTQRNKEIYIKWKNGMSFTKIAHEYKLSTTTVSSACHLIEFSLASEKAPRHNKYKDLQNF